MHFRNALLFLLLLTSFSTSASIGNRFGLTSEGAAIAGATVGASSISSASVFDNPAQMSFLPEGEKSPSIHFHWSILYSDPQFSEIRNVVVENPVNSDINNGNTPRYSDVNTDYPATFGQSLGFSIRSKKSDHHWGIGAIAYLPLNHIALVDSGETFVPEYVLHRGSTQKPEFQFAFSGLITDRFSLGFGVYLGAKLTSDTTVFLNQGSGTRSSMRVAANIKTEATPYLGATVLLSKTLSAGTVIHLASHAPETLNVQAGARAIGNVSALDFAFSSVGTPYYEPFSIRSGTQWRYANEETLSLQLEYQDWSKYEAPSILILDPNTQTCSPNCGVDFSQGVKFSHPTRSVFIPRIGHTWSFGGSEFRIGYAYRPGIYRDIPNGAGNMIDPDEHRLTTGYGWEVASLPFFDAPGRFSLHAAYSLYPKKSVVKTSGDENENTLNSKIGAPGYETGGSEWGSGFTLELFL